MKYLITGGTGTAGKKLASSLIKLNKQVTIFSRNEEAQIKMKKEYPSCNFFVGDVRDHQECLRATEGIDIVYHLAAMKHVARCESQPEEAIKTNINGTINMINAANQNKIKEFIYLSTDKVVNPISLYGITKLAAERIVISANKSKTRFSVVRSGNILGSSNSIVPILKDQILKTNSVQITCGEMTRFFILPQELIDHLISDRIKSGKIFIPEMKAFRLIDLAKTMFKKYGTGKFNCEEIGLFPGERVHEYLFARHEINRIVSNKGLWIGDAKQTCINDIHCSYDFVVLNTIYEQYL